MVIVLVAVGTEINNINTFDSTPLHEACRYGHLETVKVLIRARVDVRFMNNHGESPVNVAETNEIRQYIHQHYPLQRRRPLILTRPHGDHATNTDHKLTALGDVVTATTSIKWNYLISRE